MRHAAGLGHDTDDAPLHHRVGAAARRARRTIGWSTLEVARRAGCSPTTVTRLERDGGGVAIATVGRILDVLGARIEIDPPRLGSRIDQQDAAHAICIDHQVRRFGLAGYLAATEVEIGGGRTRGWIDLVAFDPVTRVLILDETKTEFRDAGAVDRQIGWYERAVWGAAARLGWQPRVLVTCLTMLFTAANEAAIRANSGFLARAFPVRAVDLQRMIDHPSEVSRPVGRAVALIDPRSTRRQWLRPTTLDGRRSAAPYLDYADFMRHVRAGRRRPGRR
jgi:transcriptional regulator with XRE-family HTH domain